MDQDWATFDVAQELVAEALALGGALDQAGDVSEHQHPIIALDDTELRFEGGERIGRDLGHRLRQPRQQGRFARIGIAHDADISDEFQFELQFQLDAADAGRGLAGRLVDRRLETGVTFAAGSTRGDDDALTGIDEVGNDLAGGQVADDSPAWDLDFEILAALA